LIDIIVALVSHNELTRRGEGVLRRTLTSLTRAIDIVGRERPGVDVYVGCCDDASTDSTPDIISEHFAGRSGFKLVQNRVSRFAGYSRNLAASQFKTEVICMLDADDEYKENHLVACLDRLDRRDPSGRLIAAVSVTADFNVPVHPEWVVPISASITITKAVRRIAWEFVEGLPMESIYSVTGCEDQFFKIKLAEFFCFTLFPNVTATYHCYPGSYFERQLHKFTKPFDQYKPEIDDPAELRKRYRIRERLEAAFMLYLKSKWYLLGWKEKLQGYSVVAQV
jgi:glycosyltransferase involved in cell wall biosynthesis